MDNHTTVQSSASVFTTSPLQMNGTFIVIIALILIAAWLTKWSGFAPKRTGVDDLKISASISLDAREEVVVVDVEDAQLMSGITVDQINLLYKLSLSVPTEEILQIDSQSVMKNSLRRSGRF